MSEESHDAPIIVIKKHAAHGAHGGSWKVAFADFAVAMMAFFMLLWLMGGTSNEEKQQIAGYFKHPQDYQPVYDQIKSSVIAPITDSPPAVNGSDPIAFGQPKEQASTSSGLDIDAQGAVATDNSGDQSSIDQTSLNNLQTELQNQIDSSADLASFKKQIFISAIPEGIKLDIVDSEKNAMFTNASAELSEEATKILMKLAPVIEKVPNKISITGHTDAAQFVSTNGQTNWELSADRANSARRALEAGGLTPKKIAQVVGQGSTVLFDEEHPASPLNRRISIVILNQHTEKSLRKASGSNHKPQESSTAKTVTQTHSSVKSSTSTPTAPENTSSTQPSQNPSAATPGASNDAKSVALPTNSNVTENTNPAAVTGAANDAAVPTSTATNPPVTTSHVPTAATPNATQ